MLLVHTYINENTFFLYDFHIFVEIQHLIIIIILKDVGYCFFYAK